jgi:hypothetical protein
MANTNLASNVGFVEGATHTRNGSIKTTINLGIEPNHHPTFLIREAGADRYTFDHLFGGMWCRLPLSLVRLPKLAAGDAIRKMK